MLETEEDIVKIWIVRTLCKNMRLVSRTDQFVPGLTDSRFQRFVFRIAAQEALENKGLEVLANLIENHTDVKILEHTLRALAEITYPFPGKVGNKI